MTVHESCNINNYLTCRDTKKTGPVRKAISSLTREQSTLNKVMNVIYLSTQGRGCVVYSAVTAEINETVNEDGRRVSTSSHCPEGKLKYPRDNRCHLGPMTSFCACAVAIGGDGVAAENVNVWSQPWTQPDLSLESKLNQPQWDVCSTEDSFCIWAPSQWLHRHSPMNFLLEIYNDNQELPERQEACFIKNGAQRPLDLLVVNQLSRLQTGVVSRESETGVQHLVHPGRFEALMPGLERTERRVKEQREDRYSLDHSLTCATYRPEAAVFHSSLRLRCAINKQHNKS